MKKILTIAKNKLIKNGFIFFEINELFEKEIYQLILEKGFKNIYIKKDIHGKSRLVKHNYYNIFTIYNEPRGKN